MFQPLATYRVQLHHEFTFKDLQQQVPYLKALGIDTIYASPIFKARPGSTHGYDITDPLQLNPELGSPEDFKDLIQTLQENELFWLQDIVPNHMAFHPDNAWLTDIFRKGPYSEFYHFFDIDWNHPNPKLNGKLMAPFLGTSEAEALLLGDIKVAINHAGFQIYFYNNAYPASLRSWPLILDLILKIGRQNGSKTTLNLNSLQLQSERAAEQDQPDNILKTSKAILKDLQLLAKTDWFLKALKRLNQQPDKLEKILAKQYFRLTHWSDADKQINYRRFFTINELICLRMEDEHVFRTYHRFIGSLCEKYPINGLRIDHIDGLYNPLLYLKNLRQLIGKNSYICVEKILDLEEELPANWPVQGSTGYFFLALANQIFTRNSTAEALEKTYRKFVPQTIPADYEALVFEKKLLVLENHMQGETDNLFALLKHLKLLPQTPGYPEFRLKSALKIFLSAFPVYRLYFDKLPLNEQESEIIQRTFERAEKFALHLQKELTYFRQLFLENPELTGHAKERLAFIRRCQQFTGPLAAKGVEDTTFYHYNRLISHNEVGDDPDVFGITSNRFHQEMLTRLQNWPLALNSTSTHDTKRGEDARLRLNVLSEMPEAWAALLEKWDSAFQQNAEIVTDAPAPSPNRLYFLYQTLLAAMPIDKFPEPDFIQRVKITLTKAMREAKLYSSWSDPNEEYEQSVLLYLEEILAPDSAFLQSFQPFLHQVAFYGMLYSLGQTLLKITAPGIPDFYQGTEGWDLSMVDPDNRRAIDYETRKAQLQTLQNMPENARENAIKSMLAQWPDGRVKFFTMWAALQFRKQNPLLFTQGDYIPLETSNQNLLAFARKNEEQWCLIFIPLEVTKVVAPDIFPLGKNTWGDTAVKLPKAAPEQWLNLFTHEKLNSKNGLALAQVFESFPIAFLTSEIR